MEAAAGSGLGQAASGSGQAEASTRKRSRPAADQGKRVSEISRSDAPANFFNFPKRTHFSKQVHQVGSAYRVIQKLGNKSITVCEELKITAFLFGHKTAFSQVNQPYCAKPLYIFKKPSILILGFLEKICVPYPILLSATATLTFFLARYLISIFSFIVERIRYGNSTLFFN